jgi:hypothetical protein
MNLIKDIDYSISLVDKHKQGGQVAGMRPMAVVGEDLVTGTKIEIQIPNGTRSQTKAAKTIAILLEMIREER